MFNIQDVFPDAAVETGAITNRRVIAVARGSSGSATAAPTRSPCCRDDLRDNVAGKVGRRQRSKVRVIPNFVDTAVIRPMDRTTRVPRASSRIGDEPVVMYAGNVGFSQSLEMLVDAARAIAGA